MYLHHMELVHYRNYDLQSVEFQRGINILMGANGQGKTNLLESVYYLSYGTNFRGNKDQELIQWDQPYFRLHGVVKKEDTDRHFDIELYVDREKQRQLKINGSKYKNRSQLKEYLHVVLFEPNDLKIIKGSPGERRRYLDVVLSQQDVIYEKILHDYEKIVQQRNNLLKEMQYTHRRQDKQLDVWNEQLVRYGSEIIYRRIQFLKRLVPMARKVQQSLTEETERFSVTYQSSVGAIGDFNKEEIASVYEAVLQTHIGEELIKGVSLYGPHRDDLIFYLNGNELKKYGSQGQQRTAMLSLKIAELEVFHQLYDDYPILLLDDVMSELDDKRRSYLIDLVEQKNIQTIITGANIELITQKISNKSIFYIQEGKIIN